MWTRMQRGVAALTAVALIATAVPVPAAAASTKGQTVQAQTPTDFSGARRGRRGGNAAALAMFGLVAGTIATIAINESRRSRERDYWRARYGYYQAPQPYYYAPAPRHYYAPQPQYYYGR